MVICDGEGKVLATSAGPLTNHWQIGIQECAERIIDMVHEAKRNAAIPLDTPLASLGLTLSGCEQASTDAELGARVRAIDPHCCDAIYVASDTVGSLATASPDAGMVLISGTGTNGLLKSLDGETRGCGGWGHMIGDEGGAYWIAKKAVKAVFDDMDGLHPAPHRTDAVWGAVKEHFNIKTRADILPHAYTHFVKAQFAALTQRIAELASQNDAMSQHLLASAGCELGHHVAALCNKGLKVSAPLRVVCVGSVFRSWDYLKDGLLSVLARRKVKTELQFVRLLVPSAMGAAWLAAKCVNYALPRDDEAMCQIFHHYTPQTTTGANGDGHGHMCGCRVECFN